jgi:hypothetical protein
VEPNYEKKLETLDDLLNSDVVYGYQTVIYYGQDTLSYPEFVTFLEHKTLTEDCSDFRRGFERFITKIEIFSFFFHDFLATYVAKKLGTVDVDKLVCSLDESLI